MNNTLKQKFNDSRVLGGLPQYIESKKGKIHPSLERLIFWFNLCKIPYSGDLHIQKLYNLMKDQDMWLKAVDLYKEMGKLNHNTDDESLSRYEKLATEYIEIMEYCAKALYYIIDNHPDTNYFQEEFHVVL